MEFHILSRWSDDTWNNARRGLTRLLDEYGSETLNLELERR